MKTIRATLSVTDFADGEVWRPRYKTIDASKVSPELQIDPAAILHDPGPVELELTFELPKAHPFVFMPHAQHPRTHATVRAIHGKEIHQDIVSFRWHDPDNPHVGILSVRVPPPNSDNEFPTVSALHLPCVHANGVSWDNLYPDTSTNRAKLADVQGGLFIALTHPKDNLSQPLCPPVKEITSPAGTFTVTGFKDCEPPQTLWRELDYDTGTCDLEIEPAYRVSNNKLREIAIQLPEGMRFKTCDDQQPELRLLGQPAARSAPTQLSTARVDLGGRRCMIAWQRDDEIKTGGPANTDNHVGRVMAFYVTAFFEVGPHRGEKVVIDPTVIEPPACSPRTCTT